MENTIIPKHLQMRAKSIVDMLFDGHLFNEKLSRDDMQLLEDFIAQEFESFSDSAKKSLEIMEKLKHLKVGN